MLSNLLKNSKLGFLDQKTNLKTWCSNLVTFLNGSFQNGVSFQNENGFENEIKTMVKTTCKGCFEGFNGPSDDNFEGLKCMGLSSNDFGTWKES